jgi:uncharacterized protein YfdQ (DUF2303 family)
MQKDLSELMQLVETGRNFGQSEKEIIPMMIKPSAYPQVGLKSTNMELVNFKEYVPAAPDRKRIEVLLEEVESFVEYVNEHKTATTRIFARNSIFKAAIDYHGKGDNEASWITHTATLELVMPAELKILKDNNTKWMTQEEFIDFLKDNSSLIIKPDSATMLEIALTLEATKNSRCVSKARTNKGTNFSFDEGIQATAGAGGNIEIPDSIVLGVSLFEGEDPIELKADFKFRINSGTSTFSYRILELDRLLRQVKKAISKTITAKTEVAVFQGCYCNTNE